MGDSNRPLSGSPPEADLQVRILPSPPSPSSSTAGRLALNQEV